jgi:hypothetical protein
MVTTATAAKIATATATTTTTVDGKLCIVVILDPA